MKFRCERDILSAALGTAGRAVPNRGNLPVLSGLRLRLDGDMLEVAGSDLDVTIRITTTVSGAGDGTAVIPSRLVGEIVRNLEAGAVEVEIDDDAVITSGRSEFSIRTYPADEFPQLPEGEGREVVLDGAVLEHALRQVVRAASNDDNRPILTGVQLEDSDDGLRLVATDSYRLALRDLPGARDVLAADQRPLVPSKALQELVRLLSDEAEVTLVLGDREVSFKVGDAVLTTRLLEGEFPNYRQLIPASYPNRLTVGREALLDAVKRVKLLIQEPTTPVRLTMRSEGVEVAVITSDLGRAHEEVDAKYEGTELVVAFNPDYLIEGVEAISGDEVVIESTDALKPATVRSTEADDFMYLLMPVRVT